MGHRNISVDPFFLDEILIDAGGGGAWYQIPILYYIHLEAYLY